MNVSRQTLDSLAAQTGFRPGTLEKVVRLGQLAADISKSAHEGLDDAGATDLDLSLHEGQIVTNVSLSEGHIAGSSSASGRTRLRIAAPSVTL